MRLQQHCGTADRRRRVRDSAGPLNGIDYLEVLDDDAPSQALRQRILVLVFLKPDGVLAGDGTPLAGPEHFEIEGGERVRGIRVTGVAPGDDDRSLRLTLDRAGDFSIYRLSLVGGGAGGGPFAGMDPVLSCLDFSFKADCDTPFDCAAPPAAAPEPEPGPPLDYLAKDYESFRRLMLDRMAVTLPEWRDRSPADLGVTLVEALAYAADHASYYQDAVATEAYLPLARLRPSVRRHARLLGYRPSEGTNARLWVAIDVDAPAPGTAEAPALPAGSLVLTRPETPSAAAGLPPGLPIDQELPPRLRQLTQAGTQVFETLAPLGSLSPQRNAMDFHSWGDRDCCLPAGSTLAHLVGSNADLGLAAGDVLILEERGTPTAPADAGRRHAVRLAETPRDVDDPLEGITVVEIRWGPDDALPFPLILNGADGRTAVARGNVVLADHGRTLDYVYANTEPPGVVANSPHAALTGQGRTGLEPLAPSGAGGGPRARLTDGPVVHAAPYDDAAARRDPLSGRPRPARDALIQDPAAALPQVALAAGAETWRAVHDLLGSDGFAQDFVAERSEDGTAVLRFGDGRFGRRPGEAASFRARVRVGRRAQGLVGADAVGFLVPAPDATLDPGTVTGVSNPLPAAGALPPERQTTVKINAPRAFRRQRRAVTLADYEDQARAHPAVERAVAERRWTGSWHTVFLAIDPAGDSAFDAALEADLRAWLEPLRLAGHDLEIEAPDYVPLDIRLVVCVAPGHLAADVERALLRAFSAGSLPDGGRGFFHPDNYTFGTPVRLSRIIAHAMAIPGVQWVGTALPGIEEQGHFRRLWDRSIDYADGGVIPIGRRQVARLDNDPNAPERGRLDMILRGGR